MSNERHHRCAPGVRWAVSPSGVLVFRDGMHRVLTGAEAALWDLLSRDYPLGAATRLMAAIARVDAGEAERLISRSLSGWAEAGLIEVADG